MARRRSRPRTRNRGKRSNRPRPERTWDVECPTCGTVVALPVPPPEGVQLRCIECEQGDKAAEG